MAATNAFVPGEGITKLGTPEEKWNEAHVVNCHADSMKAATLEITGNVKIGGSILNEDGETMHGGTDNAGKGSTTIPVYFDENGSAQPITSYEGNAASANKATNDGDGNNIVDTYARKADLNAYATVEALAGIANRVDDIEQSGTGGGITAVIKVTTAPGATVTCIGNDKTATVIADEEGTATFKITALGEYTVNGMLGSRKSMNTEIVNVNTVAVYNVTVSFWQATLNVTAEEGAEITVTDGDTTVSKTATGTAVPFVIYNQGAVSAYATKNGVQSNTQSVTLSALNESKNVNLNFIKVTLKGIQGESVTVSKGSFHYTVSIDSSKQAVLYLPELGNWSCVGTGTLDGVTKTKNKTLQASEYKSYRVGMWTTIYSFHIDGTKSDPAQMISYTGETVGMTPAKMNYSNGVFSYGSWKNAFFMPRPCMLRFDGTVAYYLDPSDYTKKADGSASDVANTSFAGNAMMEWGQNGTKIWLKVVPDNGNDTSATVYIADDQDDDGYKAWSFIDADNNYVDHFYTPIYQGSLDGNNRLRSMSGTTNLASKTADQEITYAKANNTGSTVHWYTEVFADVQLINFLLMLMGKSMDTQATFGEGVTSGSSSGVKTSGQLNNKGLFWGAATAASTTTPVKVFGMENWWGNQWRRYAGHVTDGNSKDRIKMTYGTADGSTATGYNTNGSGYIQLNTAAPTGYVTTEAFNSIGAMTAKATGGSVTTYYCDYHWKAASCYAFRGGASDNGSGCGAFYVHLDRAASGTGWFVGAALSYR